VRLAIIDCGTNTFNILIVDAEAGGKYSRVYNTRIPVKLGEKGINKGFIAPEPFERGIDALVTYQLIAREYEVDKVIAFATSAIRDAANRKEFVEAAKGRAGIGINVIDGNREAELIYKGTREAIPFGDHTSLIMDIGGGSTEYILANKNKIEWKQSFNLGAARLLEKFNPSNPITPGEIKNIFDYLSENLQPVIQAVKDFPPVELVGSSGAFDSVVEMTNGELGGEPLTFNKTGYSVSLDNYRKISELVKKSTLEQRKEIKGLTPMRFDMIVISCLLIDFTLDTLKLDKIRVSTYSLKEGALVEFMENQQSPEA
jgi:exopolyphosphatase/guanosine-5'-triphosphate,3'-diphosphate pyrophosphatase